MIESIKEEVVIIRLEPLKKKWRVVLASPPYPVQVRLSVDHVGLIPFVFGIVAFDLECILG